MAALQCEICGGKLIGKPGGLFECDSCGMEYSTAWAKEKIQEIKGTVKVEGTVEVAGTVKVDGPVKVEGGISVQSLCERGFFDLENNTATAAKEAFERALDIELNWGDIYIGLMMTEFQFLTSFSKGGTWKSAPLRSKAEFRARLMAHDFDKHRYLEKLLTVPGSDEHAALVREYKEMLRCEAELIRENKNRGSKNIGYYQSLRKKYNWVRGRITSDGDYLLDQDGNLISRRGSYGEDFQAQAPWKDMIWITRMNGGKLLAGVFADGTVIAEDKYQRIEAFEPDDHVMQVVGYSEYDTQGFAAVQESHHLLTSICGKKGLFSETLQENSRKWKNREVEAICEIVKLSSHICPSLHLVIPSDPEFSNIAWIETGPSEMVVYLKTDGTVNLQNCPSHSMCCQIQTWGDIIQAVPGKNAVAGLKADGTVIYACAYHFLEQRCNTIKHKLSYWNDIIFIRMIGDDVIGVTREGKLVSTSDSYTSDMIEERNVRLFRNIDSLQQELLNRREEAYEEWKERMLAIQAEEEALEEEEYDPYAELREEIQYQIDAIHREMDGLKGIFAMKRRKELEEKMGRLLLELDKLSIGNGE